MVLVNRYHYKTPPTQLPYTAVASTFTKYN